MNELLAEAGWVVLWVGIQLVWIGTYVLCALAVYFVLSLMFAGPRDKP